jgi:hypothetical protein
MIFQRDRALRASAVGVRTCQSAALLLATIIAVTPLRGAAPGAQAVDRSQAPRFEASAGGFTARRLDGPVTIDGRRWIEVKEVIGAQTVRAPNGRFAIKLEDAGSAEVMHFRVWFIQNSGTPVLIAPGTAIFSWITPDSRWIINGTLEAVDVKAWRAYSLSKAFNIEPYVVLRAVSADGRRIVISQAPCWVDCQALGIADRYYEIGFPAG